MVASITQTTELLENITIVLERTIPAERRQLSAKLVPTFAHTRVSNIQHGGSPTAVISVLYTRVATFSFK
jgi:hypothetical protein